MARTTRDHRSASDKFAHARPDAAEAAMTGKAAKGTVKNSKGSNRKESESLLPTTSKRPRAPTMVSDPMVATMGSDTMNAARKATKGATVSKPAKPGKPEKLVNRGIASPATSRRNPLVPRTRALDDASLPPLPRIPPGMLLGTHVSTQGGSCCAPPRAVEIGATALQLFTKTPNQWKERRVEAGEREEFRAALDTAGSPVVVAHDSYLINLASPDDTLRARSIDSFTQELARCHALGVHYLVSHPGNFMDERDAGIRRNADSIAAALLAEPGETILCLETTAGSGTALGATFEELAAIIHALPATLRDRIGVCVDTCHIHSAGYDIVQDFDGVMAQFQRTLGLERLRVWHLNDSKTPFGSHRDRHELIGEGSLGEAPFRRIMTDPRFAHTVKILETPKLDDATHTDRTMLNRLLSFVPATSPS